MPKRRTRRAARRKELQEILDALMGMFKVHPIGTADHEKTGWGSLLNKLGLRKKLQCSLGGTPL